MFKKILPLFIALFLVACAPCDKSKCPCYKKVEQCKCADCSCDACKCGDCASKNCKCEQCKCDKCSDCSDCKGKCTKCEAEHKKHSSGLIKKVGSEDGKKCNKCPSSK